MVKPCAVPKCNKNSKRLNLKRSLFKVPVDEILRDKWRAAIPGLKATQFVCDRHFDAGCIVRRYVRRDANGQLLADIAYQKPRLTSDAVPTIFLAEGEFDRSILQHNEIKNEASMDLDSSQQEQEVAFTSCEKIAHDSSQQASSIKEDVEASKMILDATIELQQPCVPMPRAFAMVGTSKDSEMEHNLASNIEGTKVQTKKSTLSNVKKSSPASTVRKLRVSTASNISDEKGVITLPPTWSISQAPVKFGIEIIVCQIKTLMENDKKNLAVKKYIAIADWSGCMQYYVYGKEVQANEAPLPNILNDVSELPTILAKFERMRVCTGLGSVNTTFVKTAETFTDYTHSWHHNDCSLIVKRNKCESCKRFKSLLWQREHRASKNVKSKRISRVIDDQIKLKLLKKKLQTQKRFKNRAKLRMKVLTNALNEAQVQVAALKMTKVHEISNT